MMNIGWPELLVIVVVAILFIGPRELPVMLQTIGRTIGKLRRMASDFQRHFDDALQDTQLDALKKDIKEIKKIAKDDPTAQFAKVSGIPHSKNTWNDILQAGKSIEINKASEPLSSEAQNHETDIKTPKKTSLKKSSSENY